ncbi:hypothetical protein HDU97_002182 [Phlyctochytrium planicorne]|nr:hypothetical protein HDU97_002182 [Phlyctochytrium planicorne]
MDRKRTRTPNVAWSTLVNQTISSRGIEWSNIRVQIANLLRMPTKQGTIEFLRSVGRMYNPFATFEAVYRMREGRLKRSRGASNSYEKKWEEGEGSYSTESISLSPRSSLGGHLRQRVSETSSPTVMIPNDHRLSELESNTLDDDSDDPSQDDVPRGPPFDLGQLNMLQLSRIILTVLLASLAFTIHLFFVYVYILTMYMYLFRDHRPSHAPPPLKLYSARIKPPSLFGSPTCYADQTKFMLGLTLYGDRIRHDEACYPEILHAVVPEFTSARFMRVHARDREIPLKELSSAEGGEGGNGTTAKNMKNVGTCDWNGDDVARLYVDIAGGQRCLSPPRVPVAKNKEAAAQFAPPEAPESGKKSRRKGGKEEEDEGSASVVEEKTPSVLFVTYASKCTLGLNRLSRQLHQAGIPLRVLGIQKGWRGWGYRMRTYHDYLVTLPPSTIVVLSDGSDVLLNPTCSKEEIEKRWKQGRRGRWPGVTSPILVAAERTSWPDEKVAANFTTNPGVVVTPEGVRDPRDSRHPRFEILEDVKKLERKIAKAKLGSKFVEEPEPPRLGWPKKDEPSSFKYLNAGTMMGMAGDLATMLKRGFVNDCCDDQKAFTEMYLRGDVFWTDGAEGKDRMHDVENTAKDVAKWESEVVKLTKKAVQTLFEEDIEVLAKNSTLSLGSEGDDALNSARHELFMARQRLSLAAAKMDAVPQRNRRQGLRRVDADEEIDPELLKNVPVDERKNGFLHTPEHARPVFSLDFDANFMVGAHGVSRHDWDLVDVGGERPRLVRLEDGGKKKDVGKGRMRTLVLRETGSEPCFVHQSGPKYSSGMLEELARDLGLQVNWKALEKVEKMKFKGKEAPAEQDED